MPTVMITGASRGIGLSMARAFLGRGWDVIATCRDPQAAPALLTLQSSSGRIRLTQLDVADASSIDRCAEALSDVALDVLVNNAGIMDRGAAVGALDYARWREVMETNLYGPVRVLEAFLPHLLRGGHRKAVAISSSLGSVADAAGGNYYYRASKAALNITMRAIAADLKDKGVLIAVVSPGFVDTDLTRELTAPKLSPEASGEGLAAFIETMTPEDSRRFLRYNGEEIAW